jgi:hypothetical protein
MGGGCGAGRGRVGRKISGAGSVYGQLSVGWPVNGVNLGFSLLTLHTVQIASKADPTDGYGCVATTGGSKSALYNIYIKQLYLFLACYNLNDYIFYFDIVSHINKLNIILIWFKI